VDGASTVGDVATVSLVRSTEIPCALAIGGLDPGGGAGVVADLRAFAAAGVFGCAAVALLTVQSTAGLRSTRAIAPRALVAQAREVAMHQRVRAVKTGALGSEANVRAVARWLRGVRCPVVVDPVLLPSRGRGRLLEARAIDALRDVLIPRAMLVTANGPEAEVIVGARVATVSEAHDAARSILGLGARAALVKGGHLKDRMAVDVLAIGGQCIELRSLRLPVPLLHGSGCILASLVAGRLAACRVRDDRGLVRAVRWAKRVHRAALMRPLDTGGALRVLSPRT
jgi:hydroxymethylpyrimidine kinase/phosphomethylpyrimidine kinase